MATIILDYDARDAIAKKTLTYILSLGIFKERTVKTRIEQGLEDYRKGNVFYINRPKNKACHGKTQ